MTKEYALHLLNQLMIGASVDAKPIIPQYELAQALNLAIQALEQQSTGEKTYLKRREENYVEYNVEWFLKNWELELKILSGGKIKPTDAVSRSDLMNLYKEWQPRLATNVYEFGQALAALPSVTPQRPKGKWTRVVDKAGHWVWECDCKWQQRFATNFCPDCGADMRGKENED